MERGRSTRFDELSPPNLAQPERENPTIPTRGNDHRVWDDAKRDWPVRTLQNPDGSPLLRAAIGQRGHIREVPP